MAGGGFGEVVGAGWSVGLPAVSAAGC